MQIIPQEHLEKRVGIWISETYVVIPVDKKDY